MRILLVGSRNPWRMEVAIGRAAGRSGHTTLLFDDRRSRRRVGFRLTQWRVRRLAERFRPDFIFLSKCLALSPDTVACITRDVPNAMWYHDPQWHRDLDRPDIAHIAAIGRLASVFFVSGYAREWRALVGSARFLPAAGAREIVPVRYDPRFASDVAFIGTGYDASRAETLIALSTTLAVRVWGPGWEPWRSRLNWAGRSVEGRDFASVCSSASIVLGVLPTRAADAESYASDRLWMTMLAGGLYLGPWTAGLNDMLPGDRYCAWYHDVDDCAHKAHELLADAGARARIRTEGEAMAREHHTYDARLPFLLSGQEWVNPLCVTSS